MPLLRSAAAIAAGFGFVNTAMFLAGGILGALLHTAGVPGAAVPALLALGTLSAILAGWVTARIAGRAEMAHAAVLAAILAGVPVAIVLTGLPEGQRAGYMLSVGGLGALGALAGGWLRASAAQASKIGGR